MASTQTKCVGIYRSCFLVTRYGDSFFAILSRCDDISDISRMFGDHRINVYCHEFPVSLHVCEILRETCGTFSRKIHAFGVLLVEAFVSKGYFCTPNRKNLSGF